MNIALFGFMGVGKSAVGRILADRVGFTFVDLDDEIVRRKGKTISAIFEEEGEASLREVEKEVTKEFASRDHQVIACGGGTVLDDDNLSRLGASSTLILLTADPKIILNRVATNGETRPLLSGDDRPGRINSLLKSRHPRYIRAADFVVDVSDGTPESVTEDIILSLGGLGL